MILKRWALNVSGLIFGTFIGLFTIQFMSTRMVIPTLASPFIVLFFVALCMLVSYLMGSTLFPPTEAETIRPEIPRKPWAWLRPKGENKAGFPLNKSQVIIGRDVICEVMINNESVSRKHAEIVRLAEGYLLRDLGSRNGSYVNGQRVQEYLLQENDTVAIGDVQMLFEAPRRAEVVALEEPEHLSVSQLLSPDSLPLEDEIMSGSPPISEGGTEVWRRPD